MINYRGSIGFGQRALESLVGQVGTQDISDIQRAIESILSRYATVLNPRQVVCTGGSHGGFICCHLITQYPAFYRVCVVRNPVTNLLSQFVTSDIPDWGCAVAGLPHLAFHQDTKELEKNAKKLDIATNAMTHAASYLLSLSPMGNLHSELETPVIMGLGALDRRVPPTEGLQFAKAIQATGVPVKVLWYPKDCHALSSIEAYRDFTLQSIDWMQKYLVDVK